MQIKITEKGKGKDVLDIAQHYSYQLDYGQF